jgi:hypothetical protein
MTLLFYAGGGNERRIEERWKMAGVWVKGERGHRIGFGVLPIEDEGIKKRHCGARQARVHV